MTAPAESALSKPPSRDPGHWRSRPTPFGSDSNGRITYRRHPMETRLQIQSPRPPLEAYVAAILLVLLPIRALSPVGSGSGNYGLALAIVLSLAIMKVRGRYHTGHFFILAFAALATSLLLAEMAQLIPDGRRLDRELQLANLLFLVNAIAQFAAVLWSRIYLPDRLVAAFFSVGVISHYLLAPDLWAGNPWKYAFAWPVSILALSVSRGLGSVVALVGLIGITITADSRSFLGFLILTLAILLGRAKFPSEAATHSRRRRRIGAALVIALLLIAAFQLTVAASKAGYLGQRNQVVTLNEGSSGNVLVNARPEWRATLVLAQASPLSYGPGVSPSQQVSAEARAALQRADVSPYYIEDYMFGDTGIQLHSIAADMWLRYGLVGLMLALSLLSSITLRLSAMIRDRCATPMATLACLAAGWSLLFSPIGSNFQQVVFAVAILAAPTGLDHDSRTKRTQGQFTSSARLGIR